MPNLLNGGGVVMPATRKMLKLKPRKAMMTMMASGMKIKHTKNKHTPTHTPHVCNVGIYVCVFVVGYRLKNKIFAFKNCKYCICMTERY